MREFSLQWGVDKRKGRPSKPQELSSDMQNLWTDVFGENDLWWGSQEEKYTESWCWDFNEEIKWGGKDFEEEKERLWRNKARSIDFQRFILLEME